MTKIFLLCFAALLLLACQFAAAAVGTTTELSISHEALEAFSQQQKPERTKACWREGTPRGPGTFPERGGRSCPKERPDKSRGLCYPKCKDSKKVGEGSVCWDDCEQHKYKSNGLVFCCESKEVCSQLIGTIGVKLPLAVTKLVVDITTNPARVIKLLKDFKEVVQDVAKITLPQCSKVKGEEDVDAYLQQQAENEEEEEEDVDAYVEHGGEEVEEDPFWAPPQPLPVHVGEAAVN